MASTESTDFTSPGMLAFLNGNFLPVEQLHISVFDQGVVHGVAITEMLRTFQGQLPRLEEHLLRLQASADLCGLDVPFARADLREIAFRLVTHNWGQLEQPGELGLIISVTPGLNPTYTGKRDCEPTCYMHTFELPGELWADATVAGQHLAVSQVPQIPTECVPANAKTRSRMAWYLADREVRTRYPGARAVVLDQYGYVRETSTANVFVVRSERLLTPPERDVLPGICRAVTLKLARDLGFDVCETPVTMDDLLQAEEIFTTSTPYALLGVSRLNSTSAGLQFPGPRTRQLLESWNSLVGLDIHGQLRDIADRRSDARNHGSRSGEL
ncbi:MAG: aminotransferase class IV [Planctomycetaceae bacterium]|nr:aminotransferase class IV [Planctomycetaceae bacterium]